MIRTLIIELWKQSVKETHRGWFQVHPSNSIIDYRVFPVSLFLPALTMAACRTRNKVMIAVKVESIIHLFVFHLKDHRCISMTAAPTSESNFLGGVRLIFKALPQSRITMELFLERSHKWGVLSLVFQPRRGPPILRPSAQPSRWR